MRRLQRVGLSRLIGFFVWGGIILIAQLVISQGRPAFAQSNDINILYSPMVTTLHGERGASVPFQISIINQSRFFNAHFQSTVTGLREDRNGVYGTRHDEWEHDARAWIELDQTEFSIAPGQRHTINGVVHIPRNSPASGYATIITELLPEPTPDDVDAATSYFQRFTTSIEITVGSRFRPSAFISEMRIVSTSSDPGLSLTYGPGRLLFLASLENDGDIHVAGQGQLIIRDMQGRRLQSVPLGTGRGMVIPQATVDFGSVMGGLPPGQYEMEARINYGGHRPAVARSEFTIGDGGAESLISGGRGLRIDVTPAVIDLRLERQGYRAQTVTVANYDNIDIDFKVGAEDLLFDVDGIPVTVDEIGTLPHSAAPWIEIRPSEFTLRPGQRRNVVVGFRVPEGVEGGRYARITVAAEQSQSEDRDSNVVTDADVSALLTLGHEHTYGIDLDQPIWGELIADDMTQVRVGLMATNTGNMHLGLRGEALLVQIIPATEEIIDDVVFQTDERRELIEAVPLEVDMGPVLPGENRFMQAIVKTLLEPLTQYEVVIQVQQPGSPTMSRTIHLWVDAGGHVNQGLMPGESEDEGDDDNR